MKRMFLTMALVSTFAVNAQNNTKLERALFVRDSVAKVLKEYRERYIKNEAERPQIAPFILILERDVEKLQADYEKQLEIVSQGDIKAALSAYDQACKDAEEERKKRLAEAEKAAAAGDEGVVAPARMKRDLVANDYFSDNLSSKDYASLRESQLKESQLKTMVETYATKYGELLISQGKYVEAPTKDEADKEATLFAAKERELSSLNDEIFSIWSKLYYNKIYAYDLLMERSGNTSMLDLSAKVVAQAEREVNANCDLYQSGALVDYYVRKKALTKLESEVASTLKLTKSCDSLKVVMSELNNRDYRLSKIYLPYRNFINYEALEVKSGSSEISKGTISDMKVYDYGVIYRVRVGLFSSRRNISTMRGARPLYCSNSTHKGYYAYYVGGFRTEKEAEAAAERLKSIGFQEPIISVWVNGTYYPTIEDMNNSVTQYTLMISGISALTDDMKAKVADYSISRNGSAFVVGMFVEKAMADSVAADLQAMGGDIEVKVVENSKQ